VVWVDASDIEQVIARYAHAAHAVQAATDHLLGKSAESDAELFLQWLATTRRSWLIVLDDLTDPEAMQGWWPPASAFACGRVLATTRRQDAVLSGGGRAVVDIGTYSMQEAEAYLRQRLRSARAVQLFDAQAAALAEALGFLPLALAHAAAYMINEAVSCEEYLRRFNDSAAHLNDLLPREADTEGYGRQVATALLLSLDVAQASKPVGLAVPIMRLAAVLDPAGHPRALWTSDAVIRYLSTQRSAPSDGTSGMVTAAQVRAALRLLHRYGLLTDHSQAGSRAVRLHALTARAVREGTPDAAVSETVKTAAAALTELCDKVSEEDHEAKAALLANIDNLDRCAGELLWQLDGHYILRWAGRTMALDTALPHWQRLVDTSERLLGRTHALTLITRRELAMAYLLGRQRKVAFAMMQQDFSFRDNTLDLDRPRSLPHAPEPVAIAALLEDTAANRERLLGRAHPITLAGQVSLARRYWSEGNRLAAIEVLQRSLVDHRTTFGPHHPSTSAVAEQLNSWQAQHKKRWLRLIRHSRHRPSQWQQASM
jgi:hypothetical protein